MVQVNVGGVTNCFSIKLTTLQTGYYVVDEHQGSTHCYTSKTALC